MPIVDCSRYDVPLSADCLSASSRLQGTLGLYAMKATSDEIMATGIKRQVHAGEDPLRTSRSGNGGTEGQSIRYRMGLAKFPVDKDLDRFEFADSPVNEMQVKRLHEGSFLADHTNVIMVGGTGTDKTGDSYRETEQQ